MRLILKALIVSGTTLHYITIAFPSSCLTLYTIKSSLEGGGSWLLENLRAMESQSYLTVRNGATRNLCIGFDDYVQVQPTQSDS